VGAVPAQAKAFDDGGGGLERGEGGVGAARGDSPGE